MRRKAYEFFIVRMRAKNDVNGSPRRCTVTWNKYGKLVSIEDEGYRGFLLASNQVLLCDQNVSVFEYKEWLTFGRSQGIIKES